MSRYNNDPWETRTQDEIDGVRWPAPALLTPEEESALSQMAINMGRNMGQQRARIIANILQPAAEKF